MRVPLAGAAVAAVEDLHEAHAALDQPPRRQAHARPNGAVVSLVEAVELLRVGFGLLLKSNHLGHRRLHAERQLVRLDAGPQGRVVRVFGQRRAVRARRAARTRLLLLARNAGAGRPNGERVRRVDASGTPSCSGPR